MASQRTITTAMLMLIGLCACSNIDVAEWREETALHDGSTIVVFRRERAYSGGFPNSTRGRDIDSELRYEPLGVVWRHQMSDDSIRHAAAFEIFDGVPYLVLSVGDRAFCVGKSPTEPMLQVLAWKQESWAEVPISEFPIDKALWNLSADYWGVDAAADFKGFVSLREKKTGGSSGGTVGEYLAQYRRVCAQTG